MVTQAKILLVSLCVAIVGCSTVSIHVPEADQTLTTEHVLTVSLDDGGDASSFYVKLDGVDITQEFGPVSPGTTVTARTPALAMPHPDDPYHYLEAHANWQGRTPPFGATTVRVRFSALRLTLSPDPSATVECEAVCAVILEEGESAQFTVELPEAPYGDLDVTIGSAGSRLASIEGMDAGEPAIVTIPGSERRTTFSVTAIQAGELYVHAVASATEPASHKIRIP